MVRKAKVEFEEAPPEIDLNNPYGDPVKAKIIRDRLRWYYRVEGVNHLPKCRHLVQQYLDATRVVDWAKDSRPPRAPRPQEGFRFLNRPSLVGKEV